MDNLIPDIVGKAETKKFDNVPEALDFLSKNIVENNKHFEKAIKSLYEYILREKIQTDCMLRKICDEKGMDFDKLQEEVKLFMDEHWEDTKKKVIDERGLSQAIDEIFKDKDKT